MVIGRDSGKCPVLGKIPEVLDISLSADFSIDCPPVVPQSKDSPIPSSDSELAVAEIEDTSLLSQYAPDKRSILQAALSAIQASSLSIRPFFSQAMPYKRQSGIVRWRKMIRCLLSIISGLLKTELQDNMEIIRLPPGYPKRFSPRFSFAAALLFVFFGSLPLLFCVNSFLPWDQLFSSALPFNCSALFFWLRLDFFSSAYFLSARFTVWFLQQFSLPIRIPALIRLRFLSFQQFSVAEPHSLSLFGNFLLLFHGFSVLIFC